MIVAIFNTKMQLIIFHFILLTNVTFVFVNAYSFFVNFNNFDTVI